MNVANASLSQMPFHQRIVTRSPNHMWASSWATTSATTSLLAVRARRRVDEQQALAERDAAEVLHRPGGEVRQGEEVDLVARVGDAVVVLEPAQGEGADVEGEAGQVGLAGNVIHAQRDAVDVDRAGGLQRADDEGHEVAAHHHRVGEGDRHRSVGALLTSDSRGCSTRPSAPGRSPA